MTEMAWHFQPLAALVGRCLMAALFVSAGAAKALSPRPFLDHMREFGVAGGLIIPVIVLEIGAGVALLTGLMAGYAALALAIFCVIAALTFHRDLSNKAERTLFAKDLALAGGLLAIAAAQPAASVF